MKKQIVEILKELDNTKLSESSRFWKYWPILSKYIKEQSQRINDLEVSVKGVQLGGRNVQREMAAKIKELEERIHDYDCVSDLYQDDLEKKINKYTKLIEVYEGALTELEDKEVAIKGWQVAKDALQKGREIKNASR